MISDVPGDDPAFIASGPTVAEQSTNEDARRILDQYGIEYGASIARVLDGENPVIPAGDQRLSRTENRVISAPSQSIAAAGARAAADGLTVKNLGDDLEGEAKDLAASQVRQVLAIQQGLDPADPPVLVLSGGECTVSGRGGGIGGPNAEFALSAAIHLDGCEGIHAIACDTDGVDGAAEVAGASIGPDTLDKARAIQAAPHDFLRRNDSHHFFALINDQVVTGPTLTNVNDFRAFIIQPKREDYMLKHCVFVKFDAAAVASDRQQVLVDLGSLVGEIDGMMDYSHGPNLDFEKKSPGFSYGFICTFKDRAAHLVYETHPKHVALGSRLVEMCEGGHQGIMVFDLEVPDR